MTHDCAFTARELQIITDALHQQVEAFNLRERHYAADVVDCVRVKASRMLKRALDERIAADVLGDTLNALINGPQD